MNQDKQDKLIEEDLVAELSRVYGRAATLCMRLGKKYRKLAGDYCEASLRVIEAGLKEQQTDARLEALCAAYVQKSDWYLLEDTPDIDKALELCIHCAAILEGLDVRERTASTQNHLADIYHRIGLLYGKKAMMPAGQRRPTISNAAGSCCWISYQKSPVCRHDGMSSTQNAHRQCSVAIMAS